MSAFEIRQGDALELNPEYVAMARRRIAGPLFAQEPTA